MDLPAKDQICDAVTILTKAQVMDYNGHASLRDVDTGFLINSGASNRARMTADQVCHVDDHGNGTQDQKPPNEAQLHAQIYRANPDVKAIVHGHPKWSTLYTLTGCDIPIVMPQGCLVADLPIYPKAHSISTPERAMDVAKLLGQNAGILLAGHGSVFVGATLQQAVARAIYCEQNAERAYMARALGTVTAIPKDEWPDYCSNLGKPALYKKCWVFHLS